QRTLLSYPRFLLNQGRERHGPMNVYSGAARFEPALPELRRHQPHQQGGSNLVCQLIRRREQIPLQRLGLRSPFSNRGRISRRLQERIGLHHTLCFEQPRDIEHVAAFGNCEIEMEYVSPDDAVEYISSTGWGGKPIFACLEFRRRFHSPQNPKL